MKDTLPQEAGRLFAEFVRVIAKLRDPDGGCPWDLKQTHTSLKPYLLEESHEVLEAIDSTPHAIPEELGDVLLQVVLHSQIGVDEGTFSIVDVVKTVTDKMVSRHPHVFGEVKVKDEEEVLRRWQALKAAEGAATQGEAPKSLLDGIPKALPALLKAQQLGERAARIGFDWTKPADVMDKVREEVNELLAEVDGSNNGDARAKKAIEEEFGDVLFALTQLARHMKLEAELVLESANQKFLRRFKRMEALAGGSLTGQAPEALDALWNRVKEEEHSAK